MEDIWSYERKEEENYYYILGSVESSTVEQITAEYKVRALQLHPDKNPNDPQAQEKFQQLQIAKEMLCDPEKRAKYDRWKNSGLSISYKQFQAMSEQKMCHTFHWAKPNTSGRMLETTQPSHVSSQNQSEVEQTFTRTSSVRVPQPGQVWERDTSEFIRKFRNYEI